MLAVKRVSCDMNNPGCMSPVVRAKTPPYPGPTS